IVRNFSSSNNPVYISAYFGKFVSGEEIIPVGEPNSQEYLKKKEELITKQFDCDQTKKELDEILGL
ncbi:22393_t:CDS:1, partial [Gigaspora rosea]